MSYGDLTEGEQAHWNEYTNLRAISDWPGFDAEQDGRRADSRTWLQDRRQYIFDLAEGNVPGETPGWDVGDRQARYDFLADSNLNAGAPKHEVRLPAPGTCTDAEKVYVEEREVYLVFTSTTDEQKARKQTNVDVLVSKRKKLWHLMQDDPDGNDGNDRQARYDALCIATHYGSAYEDWDKTHNKYGDPIDTGGGGNARDKAMDHMAKREGYKESPVGSNFDSRSDGIKTCQRETAGGGTWLDYTPWCGSWCFYALEAAGVKGLNSNLASVAYIEDAAKQGLACFRGWTTDRSKPQRGDLVVIGGYGVHVEMVRGFEGSNTLTWGGNTSGNYEGSQSNGDGAYKRSRAPSEVRGYALVDFPG
jgi:hypothetical protein